MKTDRVLPARTCVLLALALSLTFSGGAQTTQFTYQGMLKTNGCPVTGLYDFRVTIYDGPTPFAAALATTPPFIGTNVDSGLFTLPIDLGISLWNQGSNRWLELAVKTNGAVSWQTLSPRTLVTPTPYAMSAYTASSVANNAVTEPMIAGGQVVKSLNGLTDQVSLSPGPNIAFATNGHNIQISVAGGLCSPWCLTGNAGTIPGLNFVGTTDNQALEIKVNNTRALRIEPTGAAPTLTGGYYQNYASGPGAVIAGGGTSGSINEAAGNYAFVGAGHGSKAGPFSVVAGGAYNVTLSQFSLIGTGLANTNQSDGAVIVGGTNNLIQAGSDGSAIGGGRNNLIQASSPLATIAAGEGNTIVSGAYSTVGGGFGNTNRENFATVGGGVFNSSSAFAATVSGGDANASTGLWATVGGGRGNTSSGDSATVSGGQGNTSGDFATVSGGTLNTSSGYLGTVGGGYGNASSGQGGTVAGGASNICQAALSSIGGGSNNTIQASASGAVIAGGRGNSVQSNSVSAMIGGGSLNIIQAGSSTVIAGGYENWIQSGGDFSAIGGGVGNTIQTNAGFATIGGGDFNTVQPQAGYATIGGGVDNAIQYDALGSTVGGGEENTIEAYAGISTIGGGYFNKIHTNAYYSTIGGGDLNSIEIGAYDSTIPGGEKNVAAGPYSFAAGQQAQALHQGAFVWADSQNAPFVSTAADQFNIRAQGGVQLSRGTALHWSSDSALVDNQGGAIELGDSNASGTTPFIDFHWGISSPQDFNVRIINDANEQLSIRRAGSATPMATFNAAGLTVNGTLVSTSDRNRKENFLPVDAAEVLAKVAGLPLSKWNYKEDTASTHLGPMAQDFYAAFGFGPDDKHIATVDAEGVALAAIQGLNQKLQEKDAAIEALQHRLERLEKLLPASRDEASR